MSGEINLQFILKFVRGFFSSLIYTGTFLVTNVLKILSDKILNINQISVVIRPTENFDETYFDI